MKPPPFRYFDPGSLDEALELLSTEDNAKLLAGGQSLMPMLNMRFVQPDCVIDLNRVTGLAGISERDGLLRIGAMTRQHELETSALVRARCPLMHEALRHVGHRQTRNRGTIGGSLCHLDPAAELVAVATAQDAIVEVAGRGGTRDIPFAAFPAFYMTPAIEPGEIVTGIRLGPWPEGHGSAFVELARRHGDFAIVAVAALVALDGESRIRRAAITVSGLAFKPERMSEAEAMLSGERPGAALIESAARACASWPDVTGDVHASADYRRHLARVLSERALRAALARARAEGPQHRGAP